MKKIVALVCCLASFASFADHKIDFGINGCRSYGLSFKSGTLLQTKRGGWRFTDDKQATYYPGNAGVVSGDYLFTLKDEGPNVRLVVTNTATGAVNKSNNGIFELHNDYEMISGFVKYTVLTRQEGKKIIHTLLIGNAKGHTAIDIDNNRLDWGEINIIGTPRKIEKKSDLTLIDYLKVPCAQWGDDAPSADFALALYWKGDGFLRWDTIGADGEFKNTGEFEWVGQLGVPADIYLSSVGVTPYWDQQGVYCVILATKGNAKDDSPDKNYGSTNRFSIQYNGKNNYNLIDRKQNTRDFYMDPNGTCFSSLTPESNNRTWIKLHEVGFVFDKVKISTLDNHEGGYNTNEAEIKAKGIEPQFIEEENLSGLIPMGWCLSTIPSYSGCTKDEPIRGKFGCYFNQTVSSSIKVDLEPSYNGAFEKKASSEFGGITTIGGQLNVKWMAAYKHNWEKTISKQIETSVNNPYYGGMICTGAKPMLKYAMCVGINNEPAHYLDQPNIKPTVHVAAVPAPLDEDQTSMLATSIVTPGTSERGETEAATIGAYPMAPGLLVSAPEGNNPEVLWDNFVKTCETLSRLEKDKHIEMWSTAAHKFRDTDTTSIITIGLKKVSSHALAAEGSLEKKWSIGFKAGSGDAKAAFETSWTHGIKMKAGVGGTWTNDFKWRLSYEGLPRHLAYETECTGIIYQINIPQLRNNLSTRNPEKNGGYDLRFIPDWLWSSSHKFLLLAFKDISTHKFPDGHKSEDVTPTNLKEMLKSKN